MPMLSTLLPPECIETILANLAPKQRFRVATDFRFLFVRDQCVPRLKRATLYWASSKGQCDLLEWWKRSGLAMIYDHCEMDVASAKGHVHVLAWWKQSGLELKYSWGVDYASGNGHLRVLEWWKASGLVVDYDHDSMNDASRKGYIHILDWWKESGLVLLYTEKSMDAASILGNVAVLQWWKRSGLELKYTECAMDGASRHGHVHVLDWWWKESGVKLKYTWKAMDCASRNGHVAVLNWWKHAAHSKGQTRYHAYFENMNYRRSARLEALRAAQYVPLHRIQLLYTMDALGDRLTADVLEWWKQSGFLFNHNNGLVLSIVNQKEKK